jgi:pyrroloquinoline quinone (PQQ) biosynthesis protein C
MTFASTAIMVPADPAYAVAVGTTQKPLFGTTAHASRAPSPGLRLPRVPTATANITHIPAANASGPINWLADVSRHAAANESVAEVARICARRTTGQTRCTRVLPRAAPHPTSLPATKQTRASTAQIVPAGQRRQWAWARHLDTVRAMPTDRIQQVLAEAIVGRHLLTHPFYRRWEAGTLTGGELASYAEQYRHIERAFPGSLAAIAAQLPEGEARRLVEANLADECGKPAPHIELFESFADAAGAAADVAPTPSTAAMLALVRTAVAMDPVAALSMVAAYEVQASDIAASKADGLRTHYGMDGDGTFFWDVHRTQEVEHAGWTMEALEALNADPVVVQAAATVSADSWWLFLSEREEMAPAAVV